MGTYSNRNYILPEGSNGTSVSHFAWFYPRSYLPPKTMTAPPHGTKFNPDPVVHVASVRTTPQEMDPATDETPGSKATKAKKLKNSTKDQKQIPSKVLKPKKQSKKSLSRKSKGQSMPEAKREKKNLNIEIDHTKFDLSGVPSPFCSCTGVPRVCYKWGAGGWQSSCCTTSISVYPLPMSSTRPGSRLAGRKMSNGAYKKLLIKLATEGYNLSCPLDLKNHWARHGTNKFVTIK